MGFRTLDCSDGIVEQFKKNPDGTFSIRRVQDVEPVLDDNQRESLSAPSGWKGDLHKVASIPLIIVEQWWKELGSDPFNKANRQWLIAKLNSSEFGKLRTKEGRI